MKTLTHLFVALILLTASTFLFGQDSKDTEKPSTLVFSQNMVQMSDMGKVNKMVDEIFVPILNALVDEGMLFGWGQLNHAWGDEWNLNFYYIAKDMDAFNNFWSEYVNRVREQHPDAFGNIVQYFQAHKDNMYSIQQMYTAN